MISWRRGRSLQMVHLQTKENAQSCHQRLFEENVRKTKRGSTNFKKWRFGSCLRTGKVLAPHASVTKGRQPLIKCAKSWLLIYYISLYYVFCYLFGVDKSRAFAPTYPQLQWGTQTYVVLWIARKLCGVLILDFKMVCFSW